MKELRLLIADDSKTDRLILQTLLKEEGYTVYVARDGQEAIDAYCKYHPDIVLIDAIMPNVDGYQATKTIKELAANSFVPILFLTSLTDASSLARCLEVGGDDFLTKPYNQIILKAKITAFTRMIELHTTVKGQRDQIELFHNELVSEQHLARKIFDNIAHSGCLDSSNIFYNQNPMSIFNGDILLAAKKPSGSVQIFMGDFTGHSLPAAIGAMPVSEIFYGMTLKGISMEETLKEINGRLSHILPTGIFCCAICVEIDYDLKIGRIWNGGLPDAYQLTSKNGIKASFPSKHLALGILNNSSFSAETVLFNFEENDSLFLSTDGIIESESPSGEMFGTDRLVDILDAHSKEIKFNSVLKEISDFSDEQTDDITFLEILGGDAEVETNLVERHHVENKNLNWDIHYCFEVESLKSFDPLPLMVQPLMEVPELRQHRSCIFTVLSELYTNALEHGILGLQSKNPSENESFSSYYRKKEKRLKELSEGRIKVKISLQAINESVDVVIVITDTGNGFDFKNIQDEVASKNVAIRGIPLLKNLCSSLSFNKNGRQAIARLNWSHSDEL